MLSYTATADLRRVGLHHSATAVPTACAKTENEGDEKHFDESDVEDEDEVQIDRPYDDEYKQEERV